jgi:hypothetical protein
MEALAKKLLEKLLLDGERIAAGVRMRAAALTASHLQPYRSTSSLQDKEEFEAVMWSTREAGAVRLTWDGGQPESRAPEDFIERVDLVDINRLAVQLGRTLQEELVTQAGEKFVGYIEAYPVLLDILQRWSKLRPVRGFGPDDAQAWLDAICVIQSSSKFQDPDAVALPIREASYQLFKDTKRIEKLAPAVDVLLTGDVDAESRTHDEVWKEIGLFREEHPIRLAGNTIVVRDRVTSVLDRPYVGLPAASISTLGSTPQYLMTIENQTTFHSEARRLCDEEVLLIFTSGMPTPSWRAAYVRLLESLPSTMPVYHWGDVDEGGFRIAALLSRDAKSAGHALLPWRMHPDDIPTELRRPTTPGVATKMQTYAEAAGWSDLGKALFEAKITVEQEGFGAHDRTQDI